MNKPSVAILVRVSTAKQETDRQITELTAHAEAQGWQVVEVCTETISGRADQSDRSGLIRVMELAKTGIIKKVLVHEVSRLARRNSIVHRFVEDLEVLGVSLYWHSQRIETLLPTGKRNPAAGIMLALLSEMARAEVETLRERINSGLAEARRKGVRLGRPAGSTVDSAEFLRANAKVQRLLRDGHSVRHAAKLAEVSPGTVMKVKKLLQP